MFWKKISSNEFSGGKENQTTVDRRFHISSAIEFEVRNLDIVDVKVRGKFSVSPEIILSSKMTGGAVLVSPFVRRARCVALALVLAILVCSAAYSGHGSASEYLLD